MALDTTEYACMDDRDLTTYQKVQRARQTVRCLKGQIKKLRKDKRTLKRLTAKAERLQNTLRLEEPNRW